MADSIMIAELKSGEAFRDCIYLKRNVEVKTAKNGPYLQMTLSDVSGQKTAKKWQASEEEIAIGLEAQFLSVSGSVEKEGQYKGDIKIDSILAVDEPANLDGFLAPYPEHHAEHLRRFSELMKSIREPSLSRLLRVIFNPAEGTWKSFKSASAAQYRHHAYRGGLLEHSVEVAELCDNSCTVLTHLRRDFLVTCALIHDIGKLEEMEHGLTAGAFTETGTLVGHTAYGSYLVGSAAAKIENFPKSLTSGLMHMILSHHGKPEWGAAQAPACAEAFVLHECDNMSAKAHECHKASSLAAPGQFTVKAGPKEYYYTGDFGLQTAPAEAAARQPVPNFTTQANQDINENLSFATVRMPIRALVAAGLPEQGSTEDGETRDVVPPTCGANFLVRVIGDSMEDEGIRERDLLFVKEIETPKNGDIVVAHMGASGEVVKRFRYDGAGGEGQQKKWLESENSRKNYPDIPVDSETRIRGKVVGLLRDF